MKASLSYLDASLPKPHPRPLTTAATAPVPPEAKPPVRDNVHAPSGRPHVQQGLHHVAREIRHAIRNEVKHSDLDQETVRAIRDLQAEFRSSLREVFHASGDGGNIDRGQVLEGMIEALQNLTAGLRELNGSEAGQETVVVDDPAVVEPGALIDASV